MRSKNYISLFFVIIFTANGFSQYIDRAKLNAYFKALSDHDKFMGTVMVTQGDLLAYANAVGYADVENKIKSSPNTIYRIGSISKTFTAALVLKAVEKEKLHLDQNIASFFPGLKNAEKITIEQLLRHRSGIHNFTDDPVYQIYYTEPATREQMLEVIIKAGSDFTPGSKAAYSNSNYVLLTMILEKVFDMTYPELIKLHIAKPLNLTNTYFGSDTNPKRNEAFSYAYFGEWDKFQETDMSVALGAGGLVSTPHELTQFANALFAGKLLKLESLALMTHFIDGFGLGLFKVPFYDKVGYGHTGGIDGFRSALFHFEDGDVTYAITSNGAGIDINDISIAVLSAVYGKEFDIPTFETMEINAEDLKAYTGTYTSSQLPLNISVFLKDEQLMAQASGQSAFPLEAKEKDIFKFDAAGIVMKFDTENLRMTLLQGGGEFAFVKEK